MLLPWPLLGWWCRDGTGGRYAGGLVRLSGWGGRINPRRTERGVPLWLWRPLGLRRWWGDIVIPPPTDEAADGSLLWLQSARLRFRPLPLLLLLCPPRPDGSCGGGGAFAKLSLLPPPLELRLPLRFRPPPFGFCICDRCRSCRICRAAARRRSAAAASDDAAAAADRLSAETEAEAEAEADARQGGEDGAICYLFALLPAFDPTTPLDLGLLFRYWASTGRWEVGCAVRLLGVGGGALLWLVRFDPTIRFVDCAPLGLSTVKAGPGATRQG